MSFSIFPEDNDQISLSIEEVNNIIEDINEHYSPVDKSEIQQLSPTELKEISDNISLYYASGISYESRKLVLLPIDPTHIYAYWSLGDYQKHAMQQPLGGNEFIIKVFSQTTDSNDKINEPAVINPVYQTTLEQSQSDTIIYVPLEDQPAVYSAFIGTTNQQDEFIPAIKSNDINIDLAINTQPVAPENSIDVAYQAMQSSLKECLPQETNRVVTKTHYASSNHSGQRHKE